MFETWVVDQSMGPMAQPENFFLTTLKAALVLLLTSVFISVGYLMIMDGILGSIPPLSVRPCPLLEQVFSGRALP
jgi:hypothetical protein